MMMMGGKAFLDTNILLRMIMSQADQHAEVDALWISGQIIREFIVQVTHPRTLRQPLTIEQAVREIEAISSLFRVADETVAVRGKLLELVQHYPTRGKQVHDANIVATMLVYKIETLLTLNMDDLNRFSDKINIVTLEPQ